MLCLCVHNSARSQMAEAFVKKHGGEYFEAESGGIVPGVLNPLVVEAMNEVGIDISQNTVDDVRDFLRDGKRYHYIISVCDADTAEACPTFPGVAERFHWDFPDPSTFEGTKEEKLPQVRELRDEIKAKVLEFIENNKIV